MVNTALTFATSQLFVFLSIPLLSRAYSIEDFGLYAQFLVFYAVIGNLANLRLADAITKNNSEDSVSLSMASFLITVAVVPLLVFSVWMLELNVKGINLLYLIVCCFLFSISRVGYFSALRNEKFTIAAISLATLNIFTVIMQLVLSDCSDGLILGLISALSITVLVLFVKDCFAFFPCRKADLIRALRDNSSYVKFLSTYSLVGVIRARLPYLLLGNTGGAAALLMFERIAAAPSTFFAATLRPVFFKKFDVSLSSFEIWSVLHGLLVLGILGVVPAMVAVQIYSSEVVGFIFGSQWSVYEFEFRMTVTAFLILSVINWLDRYFDIIKKQRTIFFLEIIILAVFCMTFAFGEYFGFDHPVFISLVVSSVFYYVMFVGSVVESLSIDKRYLFINCLIFISAYAGYHFLLWSVSQSVGGFWSIFIYGIIAISLFFIYFFYSKGGLWIRKYLFVS